MIRSIESATDAQWFWEAHSGNDPLSKIFSNLNIGDLAKVQQVSTGLHTFTVQNKSHAIFSLADVTTIDNEVVRTYQDHMRLATVPLSFEQAAARCLMAKHALSNDPRNEALTSLELCLGEAPLTPELRCAIKKYGADLKKFLLEDVHLPEGESDGIAEMLSGMHQLEVLGIKNSSFDEPLDLAWLPKLQELEFIDCPWLRTLPRIAPGSMLREIHVERCPSISMPPDLTYAKHLEELALQECSGLAAAPVIPPGSILKEFYITGSLFMSQPPDLRGATQLVTMVIHDCGALTSVPVLPEDNRLEALYITNCPRITHPPSLDLASHLKLLDLSGCSSLQVAPSIPAGSQLETIYLVDCFQLRRPPSINGALSLMHISLEGCSGLARPLTISWPNALQHVNLRGSSQPWPFGFRALPAGVLVN